MPDSDLDLTHRCQELGQDCDDRGARLQFLCEDVWERLEHDPPLASSCIEQFITLLQDREDLQLARLVIPELRPQAVAPHSPVKQDILQRICPACSSRTSPRGGSRTSNSEEALFHYDEEVRVLSEAEAYRIKSVNDNRDSDKPKG